MLLKEAFEQLDHEVELKTEQDTCEEQDKAKGVDFWSFQMTMKDPITPNNLMIF